ncbi:hypothetical protein VCRA2116O30_170147 [Vibrio crassostreae]|uniref:Uncharacterized protein n=1 Tax=Vibrio crassostreae TaxID=246167 RepID=A0A4V2V5E2_9VIBR|nr:hypothetical protein EDB35_116129 [Vibrio crassostreae]TCT46137.1 hypothetical protein EDB39_1149 [Vibrio crassostreae]TCT54256.1 hypothetical protein EDB40_114143 [Vibrio crassostreae]TCT58877.1 hypothetical protein EDB44_11812 [Vibrio crassostreae]TCT80192.1 hypothetical protein EDB43_11812 [Vibrio crassostreae]
MKEKKAPFNPYALIKYIPVTAIIAFVIYVDVFQRHYR